MPQKNLPAHPHKNPGESFTHGLFCHDISSRNANSGVWPWPYRHTDAEQKLARAGCGENPVATDVPPHRSL